jgi:flagellar basal body-associated protein FliL
MNIPTEEQYQSFLYWLGFDKLIILLFVAIVLLTIATLIFLPPRNKKKEEEKSQLYPKRYKEDD